MANILNAISGAGAATGNPYIATGSALLGLLGGGSGDTGLHGNSGMTNYQFRDYAALDSVRLAAYGKLAIQAGVSPEVVLKFYTSPDVGIPEATAKQMLGLDGSAPTSVYSTPEQQSIINTGYRQQAGTINSAAKAKADQLIAGGMDPAQATKAASTWATEQTMKTKLAGSADLTSKSIDESRNRLADVFNMGSGGVGQAAGSSGAVAAGQADAANADQSSFWNSLADLAGTLGQASASKTPVVSNTVSTPTSSWGAQLLSKTTNTLSAPKVLKPTLTSSPLVTSFR